MDGTLIDMNEAIREEMEHDPRLIVLGEDVAVRGGPFGVTRELLETFGAGRVLDTPISESGFTAAAEGAALCGVPAIAEINQAFEGAEWFGRAPDRPGMFRVALVP